MSDWIEWHGGKMPKGVKGQRVDLRFRSGHEVERQDPEDWLWEHYNSTGNGPGHIVAYRVPQPH